jgi:hypothetical protein
MNLIGKHTWHVDMTFEQVIASKNMMDFLKKTGLDVVCAVVAVPSKYPMDEMYRVMFAADISQVKS